MKTQRFEFRITVDVDEEDVRNFLGLDLLTSGDCEWSIQ